MSERSTFCPRCKHMHAGPCQEDFGPARVRATHNPAKDFTYIGPVGVFPDPKLPHGKFDKRAYQRDYMRKRRAAKP